MVMRRVKTMRTAWDREGESLHIVTSGISRFALTISLLFVVRTSWSNKFYELYRVCTIGACIYLIIFVTY